jgi:exodeoxyribonuclease V
MDGGLGKPVVEFSPAQRAVVRQIVDWIYNSRKRTFLLIAPAGAGKTEIAKHIAIHYQRRRVAAMTGKSASVLRAKGCDGATTLHRLIYRPPEVKKRADGHELLLWSKHDRSLGAGLVILDECMTADKKIMEDLLAYPVKILALGDPWQLLPVNGAVFFDRNPNAALWEVHRQAADSPVLKLARAIHHGKQVRRVEYDTDLLVDADVVICALNNTRRRTNSIIRHRRGIRSKLPVIGDRIVAMRTKLRARDPQRRIVDRRRCSR